MTEMEKKEDVIKRITTARNEGDPWFEIKITLPYEDSEKAVIATLQTNMVNLLSEGLELMVKEDMQSLPISKPNIILPS